MSWLSDAGNYWQREILPYTSTVAATAVGGVAGGAAVAGYWSQVKANEKNEQLVNKQMDFQERMSSTAHQRQMKDLLAAGLNPNLSAGGNGSSTPGGASATMVAPKIELPDYMAYGISLKQLDLAEQRLNMEKTSQTAKIAKTMSDTELNKLKKLLMNKGMVRSQLEGEASDVLRKGINFLKESVLKTPKQQRGGSGAGGSSPFRLP